MKPLINTQDFALPWSNSSNIPRLLNSQTQESKRDLGDVGRNSFSGWLRPFSSADDWPGEYTFPSVTFNLPPSSDVGVESQFMTPKDPPYKTQHNKFNTGTRDTHVQYRVYFHHRNNLNKTGLSNPTIPNAISIQDTLKLNTNPQIYFHNSDQYYISILKFLLREQERLY